ncbi:MAG: hypothetical protein ABIH26_14795 [Candidatus Eisenbacteria bacterium]
MSRRDLAAAACALALLVLQLLGGGWGPLRRADGWEEIARRAEEVRAMEEAGSRERDARDRMRAYLESVGSGADSHLPSDAPPEPWRKALRRFAPGRVEWTSDDPCRLRVRGRFADVAHLLGVIDRAPGGLRIESLEIVPDGSGVALGVRFLSAGGGL